MEEMIKRLFEELAKQTARAVFAEKARDQYEGWYQMYQTKCEKLEKELAELKEQKNEHISD